MQKSENDAEFSVLWCESCAGLVVTVKSHGAAEALYESERLGAVGV